MKNIFLTSFVRYLLECISRKAYLTVAGALIGVVAFIIATDGLLADQGRCMSLCMCTFPILVIVVPVALANSSPSLIVNGGYSNQKGTLPDTTFFLHGHVWSVQPKHCVI